MNRISIPFPTTALFLLIVGAAAPASAEALSGYVVVSSETAASSAATRQLSVSCPAGKSALGAGWAVLDETGAILEGATSYFAPSYDGTSWLVNAQNLSTFAAVWKLKLQVQCADTPASYEVVSAETAATSSSKKQVQATCPAGKSALAAGWGVLDDTSAILEGQALYSAPSWDGTSWLVNAQSLSGFASTWKLKTQLVCAALDGYEVVVASTAVSSVNPRQQSVSCPSGKVVGGAGFAALDDTAAILDGAHQYFLPSWDGTGWITNLRNASASFAPDWQQRTWLPCFTG